MRTEAPREASRSLALLISWEIWKERNARIFDRREPSALTLVVKIKSEVSLWIAAGAKCLAHLVAHV
jgi:hypothetical protein